MRKVDDGEKKKEKTRKEMKIMAEIVATYVVASQPPNGDQLQRRTYVPILQIWKISPYWTLHTNWKICFNPALALKWLKKRENVHMKNFV